MLNSIRVNCETSTYVNKSYLNSTYSNDNYLLVTLIKDIYSKINVCISLLTFPRLNLQPKDFKHAYLYLFLEDINTFKNNPAKIKIIGNFDYIDIQKVNWVNFPSNNFSNELDSEIYHSHKNSYIKIDVTHIIKVLSKFDINYNLIISPIIPSTGTFIKLSSYNSDNPPYLVIEKYEDIHETSNLLDKKIEEDTYKNEDLTDSDEKDRFLNIDFEYIQNTNPSFNNDNFEIIMKKINDLSAIVESLNNKISDMDKNLSSYKHTLERLFDIIKNLDNKDDILDKDILPPNILLKDVFDILKNINNKANIPHNNPEKFDNKIDNFFEILRKNIPSSDDTNSSSNNILSLLNIAKDTFSTLKNTSDNIDSDVDNFDILNSNFSILTDEINNLCELFSSINNKTT